MTVTIRQEAREKDAIRFRRIGRISIIMPAYNESDKITDAITRLENELQKVTDDYEIIIVDDGSSDDTYERVKSMSNPNVKIVRNERNMGKGYAFKRGVSISTGEYVILADADLEISFHDLEKYVRILRYFDIIIGSKRHPESIYIAPIMRKILSLCFNMMVRLFTGVKVSDTQTGFKAFRGDAIRRIMKLVLVKRYAFDVELLAVANLLNMRIYEMPVVIIQGRGFALKSILYMLIDTMGIVYRLKIKKWYQSNLRNGQPKYKPILDL